MLKIFGIRPTYTIGAACGLLVFLYGLTSNPIVGICTLMFLGLTTIMCLLDLADWILEQWVRR